MTHTSDFDPALLLPLFGEGFTPKGLNEAFEAKPVVAWLTDMAARFWAKNQILRDRHSATEFSVAAVARLWEKIDKSQGLQARGGAHPEKPQAFLATVFNNLLRDVLRAQLAAKRGGGQANESIDDTKRKKKEETREAEKGPTPQTILEHKQTFAQVLQLARDPGTGLSPTRRAAFIVFVSPQELGATEVDATHSGDGAGFVRAGEETVGLVGDQIVSKGLIPLLDTGGQVAIAWIARCDDASVKGWDTWYCEDRANARTALDTVQTWYRRARDVLKAKMGDA